MSKQGWYSNGFTLAELLIALAILGIIATFAIPKVLQSSQESKLNSIVKEDVSAFSGAFSAYKAANGLTTSIKAVDLMPYFNYVAVDTSSSLDPNTVGYSENCTAATPCLVMHNGSKLMLGQHSFGTNGPINQRCIEIQIDPDGVVTGRNDSIWFEIFYNGRLTSEDQANNYYHSNGGPYSSSPVPSWFQW
jgi:prepilin-type N-terminal cleavage/methylation domain-containing protein